MSVVPLDYGVYQDTCADKVQTRTWARSMPAAKVFMAEGSQGYIIETSDSPKHGKQNKEGHVKQGRKPASNVSSAILVINEILHHIHCSI